MTEQGEDEAARFFPDYSKRDHELVDYQFYNLDALPFVGFRGPPLPKAALSSGEYFTTLGAAQTVGVYVERPYPTLLSERLGLPALNLGVGGVAPSFYSAYPQLLEIANRGRFVVLQVMTARSAGNSRLRPVGPMLLRDVKHDTVGPAEGQWARIMRDEPDRLEQYVAESIETWKDENRQVLERLTVPVILFYYSYKPVDERPDFSAKTVEEFYGSFPQFINMAEVTDVAKDCAGYAECRSSRNLGHLLRSRFTGEPVVVDYGDIHPAARGMVHTHNHYYPTREMHEDAVAPLLAEIERIGVARPAS